MRGRRRKPWRTTALILVVSLLATPAVMSPEEAAAEAPGRAADLPAPASEPAPERTSAPVQGGFASLDEIPPHPSQLAARRPPPKPSTFDPARSVAVDEQTPPPRRYGATPTVPTPRR